MHSIVRYAAALVLILSACSGSIGGPPRDDVDGGGNDFHDDAGEGGAGGEGGEGGAGGDAGAGGSGGLGGSGGDGGAVIDDPCLTTVGESVSESPLRRLTNTELRNTLEVLFGPSLVFTTTLVPDEHGEGFDNQARLQSVPTARADAYNRLAEELAPRVDTLKHGCTAAMTEATCSMAFIRAFGAKAHRRPLLPTELLRYKLLYDYGKASDTHRRGIELVVTSMLQAPQFLYRLESGLGGVSGAAVKLTSYEMASRLSYFLWESMPDDALFDAAKNNLLQDAASIRAQATRMLADARAQRVVSRFFAQWFHLSGVDALTKDPFYAGFDAVKPYLTEETTRFASSVFWSSASRPSGLLSSDYVMVNGPLAAWYGIPGVTGADFRQVALTPGTQRAGVLTQASVLSLLATDKSTNPVQRGMFVRSRLLCLGLPAAPPFVPPAPPDRLGLSARERFAEHESNKSCATCHALMDPQGLGMEDFDAAGRHRTVEPTLDGGTRVVDASGALHAARDATGTFNGAVALSKLLAPTRVLSDCVGTQFFDFSMGRLADAQDACSAFKVKDAVSKQGMRQALVELVSTDAFMLRRKP